MEDKPGRNNVGTGPLCTTQMRKEREGDRLERLVGDESKTNQEDRKLRWNWIPLLSKWQWAKTETCGIGRHAGDTWATSSQCNCKSCWNWCPGVKGHRTRIVHATLSVRILCVHMYRYFTYRYWTLPNWSNWYPTCLRETSREWLQQISFAERRASGPCQLLGCGPPSLWQQLLHWSEHQQQDEEEAHHLPNWFFDFIQSFINMSISWSFWFWFPALDSEICKQC